MYDNVKTGQKVIDLIKYTYVALACITALLAFIAFGVGGGIYRIVTLGIGTVIAIALLRATREGSLAARVTLVILFLSASILGFYLMHKLQLNSFNFSFLGKLINNTMILYFLACGGILLFSPQINAIGKYYKLINELQWHWNWSGKCIGYSDKGFLWNSNGQIIGKFIDNEIYSSEGDYIGESYKGNSRLCIDKSKIGKKIESFEMTQISYKIGNDESICALKIYNQLEDFTG